MEKDKEKLSYRNLVEKRQNYIEQVSEEINLCTELNTKVIDGKISVNYLFGEMNYKCSEKTVMADVFRFFHHFGSRISQWGLDSKLKELTK